jgi:acetolactate synthase I/II/III large subunit
MKVSDYIVKYLESIGVKNVYYLSGGMIMHLVDSLSKSKLNLIPVINEEDATMMSEADNIYANRLNSVVVVTAGPGVLNSVNAIASAYIDSVPMLIIGGQCKTADSKFGTYLRQKGVQEVDTISVLTSITKYVQNVSTSKLIKYYLQKVIYLSEVERKGPCFLEIPLNVQNEEIDVNTLTGFSHNLTDYPVSDETEVLKIKNNIDKLIELLKDSKKPIILAGNGIRSADALDQFKLLMSYTSIPTLLTWKSKDFFDDRYVFGIPGSISSRYANNILQECDLLISIGARIDLPTCAYSYERFAPKAKKIIVDIDQAEIDKLEFEKELVFNCDAKIFIERLLEQKHKINDYGTSEWKGWCIDQKEKYPIFTHESKLIDPYTFVEKLSEFVDEDDIIVASSSGSASEIMAQAYKMKEGQRYISSNGLGSMGYAVSAAVGACISSEKKRVICVEGDGSFAMNFKSLHLIQKYKFPIKIFVWNNGGYQSIKNTHNKFFNNADVINDLIFPEIKRIANAYKISWTYYESNEEVKDMLAWELADNYPTIIECMIDPQISTQPRVQSYIDKDGRIQSGKLENMWPFINE